MLHMFYFLRLSRRVLVPTCELHVQSLIIRNITTLRILCFDVNCEVSRNVIFCTSLPVSVLGSDEFTNILIVFISQVHCVNDDST